MCRYIKAHTVNQKLSSCFLSGKQNHSFFISSGNSDSNLSVLKEQHFNNGDEIMKSVKSVWFILFICVGLLWARRNEQLGESGMYLKLGLGGVRFQDVTQADMMYGGAGAQFSFGYRRLLPRDNYLWGDFNVGGSIQGSTTNDVSSVIELTFNPSLRYLHRFYITSHKWWELGSDITWDFTIRSNPRLQNNKLSSLFHNDLMLTGGYGFFLKDKPLNFRASIAILSFVNKLNGFAFSTNQTTLENGEFSYDDDPELFYSGSQFRHLGRGYASVKSEISYKLSPRWELAYDWSMLSHRYLNIEKKRLVRDAHTITMTLLF